MTLLSPDALNEIEARHKRSAADIELAGGDTPATEIFIAQSHRDRAALLAHVRSLSQPKSEAEMRDLLVETVHSRGRSMIGFSTEQEGDVVAAMSRLSPPQVDRDGPWALCYLHDWDPPRDGQEHKWEPGKNVFPEVHAIYETSQEALAVQKTMSNPEKYWVVRARWEDKGRIATAIRALKGM